MVTAGILPFRENSHGRTGNRTRDLMISRQILWPLDHDARLLVYKVRYLYFIYGCGETRFCWNYSYLMHYMERPASRFGYFTPVEMGPIALNLRRRVSHKIKVLFSCTQVNSIRYPVLSLAHCSLQNAVSSYNSVTSVRTYRAPNSTAWPRGTSVRLTLTCDLPAGFDLV